MITLEQIIAGLNIIKEVEPDADLRAEHDEIWCGSDTSKYSTAQKAELEANGWTEDEGCGWHRFV